MGDPGGDCPGYCFSSAGVAGGNAASALWSSRSRYALHRLLGVGSLPAVHPAVVLLPAPGKIVLPANRSVCQRRPVLPGTYSQSGTGERMPDCGMVRLRSLPPQPQYLCPGRGACHSRSDDCRHCARPYPAAHTRRHRLLPLPLPRAEPKRTQCLLDKVATQIAGSVLMSVPSTLANGQAGIECIPVPTSPCHVERRRVPARFRGPAKRGVCAWWVGRGSPESKHLVFVLRTTLLRLIKSTFPRKIKMPAHIATATVSFQFGKGSRDDLRKPSINSRTRLRRSINCSSKCSRSLIDDPYHSGGTDSAMVQSVCGSRLSMRDNQGSNESHPRTSE